MDKPGIPPQLVAISRILRISGLPFYALGNHCMPIKLGVHIGASNDSTS